MSTAITSIGKLGVTPPTALPSSQSVAKATDAGTDSFGSVVSQAVGSLQALQGDADTKAADFATGGDVQLSDLMISTEQLSLGFQLAMQVRNKVVDAYQEIMRMQV
jgi:flagellar hook-basal body complex protein FliE